MSGMNSWNTFTDTVSRVGERGKQLSRRTRGAQKRIALFLAVVGPGLITSNVDNDAGGISTYTGAGAQFGYTLLWSLIPMTIALYVSGEMCARMGVMTGKGLSDLIREEFGFRSTFFVIVAALFVDLANTVAEFAGVAEASQVMHVSKYIAVPLAALAVWLLVVYGTYRIVEKIFLVACGFYLSYVASALLAKPDWLFAAKETVIPTAHMNAPYLLMLTGLVGTTIAPWQFFYMQAGFVEKRVGPRQYKHAKTPTVLVGSISVHGDRLLHHRVLRGDAERDRADEHFERGRSGTGAGPTGREVGGISFRVWAAERVALCGIDSAALHGARSVRRNGVRGRAGSQIPRGPHVLFAVYPADHRRCGNRAAAEGAAVEDPDLFAGGQRNLAASGADLYPAADQPQGSDGRAREHVGIQSWWRGPRA